MSTTFTQEQMAASVKQAGVPDMLNRYLTMTPEQIAAADAAVRRQVDDYRKRRIEPMKAPAIGSKVAQIAGLKKNVERALRTHVVPHGTPVVPTARGRKKLAEHGVSAKAAGFQQIPATEEKPLSTSAQMVDDNSNAGAPAQAATEAPGPTQEPNMKTAKKTATTRKPKGKAKSAARRKVKSTAARPTKAKVAGEPKVKAPKGMVIEILKLSSRPNGVTPAELNDLTKWKGAPWKWLFSNPKKNGYCDRWGYKFEVLSPEGGGVAYKTTKIDA